MDERLLGVWDCTEPGADETFVLTMVDFDGKQYYMDADTWPHRAYTTALEGTRVLNFAILGEQDDWLYARYSFPEMGRLEIRTVRVAPFEDVLESRDEVRHLLARNLDNGEFYDAAITCARRSGEDEEAGEQDDAPAEGRKEVSE